MNNSPAPQPQKRKYSSAMIAIIICAAIVAGAVTIAILNPGEGLDILPSLIGDNRSKVHFSDMQYTRPDSEKLISDLETLIKMIQRGDSFTDQRSLFNQINIDFTNFMTMRMIAKIRHSSNTEDQFYFKEQYELENAYILISEKRNLLFDTIAASPSKTNYERTYFGVGYFTDWVNLVYPEEVTALMQQENDLINEYTLLMQDPSIVLNGKEIFINSAEFHSLSDDDYSKVLDLFYAKYSKLAGDIFIKLVKLRKEIARLQNTDYLTLSYKNYDRDYTPEQALEYLNSIAQTVVPVIEDLEFDPLFAYQYVDSSASLYALADATKNMGKVINEAFRYMFDYGLYDVAYAPNKINMSFTLHLSNYNAPFMFISPQNTVDDYFTFAHEFGHYVDSYKNQGYIPTVDAAEITSQAMSYLFPYYTNSVSGISANQLSKYSVYLATEIYTFQSYLSEFEHRVYTLDTKDITLDKINSIAFECAKKFGLSENAEIYSQSWISVNHLFSNPMYVISYVVSNDAALQILDAELKKPGSGGIDAFIKMIDRDENMSFIEELTDSGFESPFAIGRNEKIAALIKKIMTGPEESAPSESSPEKSIETTPAQSTLLPAA